MVINHSVILRTLGLLLVLLAAAMVVPLAVSLYYGDTGLRPLAVGAAATLGVGAVLVLLFRHSPQEIRSRSAFLLVTVAWFAITTCGAIPFYLSGGFQSFVDAWFESASGFTTTGASVLTDIEALPPSILLWRSMTQFLGGMGIIVLSLAILPMLGVGGMDLFRAEVPGPTSTKISARVRETARALWLVYLVLAAVQAILLWVCGMSPFEAVNHAFTTLATGGFSTQNESIAGFDSASIEVVTTVFMFLAGANFVLHYRLLVDRDWSFFKDSELKFYALVVTGATLLLTIVVWGTQYRSLLDALRFCSFQVISIISTTGYASADYLLWGSFAQVLLLLLMVIGGCAGSTAGGVKCVRIMMMLKHAHRELYRMVHPKAVATLKLGRAPVSEQVMAAILGFFFFYIVLAALTTAVISACGVDLVTALSSVISSLSNVGPGLGEVGPVLNYGGLPDLVKVLLSVCMIVGRLEIMTVLVLFTSDYWSS
ncbi:MAG: TrkH family potassium uptake protein [Bdellovibrionales bacterium]|nr:TrkH family potassium uptake protein [Bdellovibrionales bacterium]